MSPAPLARHVSLYTQIKITLDGDGVDGTRKRGGGAKNMNQKEVLKSTHLIRHMCI
jgi:hypothetical protein